MPWTTTSGGAFSRAGPGAGNRDRARPRGRPGGVRCMGSDHQARPTLLLDDVLRLLEGIPLDGDRRLAPRRLLRVPAPRSRQSLSLGGRPAPAAGRGRGAPRLARPHHLVPDQLVGRHGGRPPLPGLRCPRRARGAARACGGPSPVRVQSATLASLGLGVAGPRADVVRGAIEACRLEAREPAGVRLGGSGDAVRAEKVAIGLASPSRPHHGALVRGSCAPHRSGSLRGGPQQRLGLAHLPSRRGVRTSKPLQLNPLPTRHLQSPSRSHHPTHTTTDHYLSDTSPVYPIGGTLAKCDPFGTPSTSHWTGAAIIVQSPRTKTCIVTRSRTLTRPMPFSLAGLLTK